MVGLVIMEIMISNGNDDGSNYNIDSTNTGNNMIMAIVIIMSAMIAVLIRRILSATLIIHQH